MRFLSRALLGLVLFLVTVAIIGYAAYTFKEMYKNKPEPFKRQARERTWQVETIRTSPVDIPITVKAFGTVATGSALTIRPEIAGKVINVSADFRDGRIVDEGELLFSIDPFRLEKDVSDAELALENADEQISELELQIANEEASRAEGGAALSQAQEEYRRKKKLGDRGFVSKAAVQNASTALANAKKIDSAAGRTISVLRKRIAQVENARDRARNALDRVSRNLETSEFYAPYTGLISGADLEVGRQVSTSEQLGTLVDLSALEANFRIADRDVGQLLGDSGMTDEMVGRKIDIVWKLGSREFDFKGQVTRVGSSVNASQGGLEVFAKLEDLTIETPLRPGAFVEVTLDAGEEKGIYALPQSSVSPTGQLYYVNGQNRVEVLEVAMVRREGSNVLVRGDIAADQDLIVNRFPQISQGIKVKVASRDGKAVDTKSSMVKLSEARRKELMAGIENSPMPDFVKKRMAKNFESEEVPRAVLERMRDMGGTVIPELDEQGGASTDSSGNAQSDDIILGDETKAALLAAVNGNQRMPADRKQQTLDQVNSGTMSRDRLERMAGRMGVEVPELSQKAAPVPASSARPTGPRPSAAQDGDTVTLTEERRKELLAGIENSQMPAFIKQRVAKNFETIDVPRATLERMRDMGGTEIPELDEKAGSETPSKPEAPSTESQSDTGSGDDVELSDITRAALLEAIESNQRMPEDRKNMILEQVKLGSMPRSQLERMAGRMNIEVPELEGNVGVENNSGDLTVGKDRTSLIPKPRPGSLNTAKPETGEPEPGTINLSKERRDEIRAAIEASPAPDFVKKRILANFETDTVPRDVLEQLQNRMGLEVPELGAK